MRAPCSSAKRWRSAGDGSTIVLLKSGSTPRALLCCFQSRARDTGSGRRIVRISGLPRHQFTEDRFRSRSSPRQRYVAARGWTAVEYVDRGVSGAKDRRSALDQLLTDARRRRVDVLVCGRLDRLGRNLKHLITLLDELQALGVGFVSLNEGIDATTPAGKLQLHILAALAEFERARIVERIRAGLARRAAHGKPLGRPRQTISPADVTRTEATVLGVSHAAVHRARRLSQKPPETDREISPEHLPS